MPGRIHFGVYELDPEALELRKHGVLIRLQDQPLEVLTALLERPGEVVTREQLQERIWGKDTFVDFEQSLNKALNDDPAHPRYVETVPRRGYRFIAPVTGSTSIKPEMTAPGTENSVPYLFRARKIVAMAAGTLAIAGIIVAFLWLRKSRRG